MSDKPKSRVAEPALARKNMDMNVDKLERARLILGARTDTETIDRALDAVIAQDAECAALDRLAAAGGIIDIFARAARPRSAKG